MEAQTPNIWNKTAAELTVKDRAIITVASPILYVGGMVAAGTVLIVTNAIVNKFRKNEPVQIETPEEN